ncbi:MAG: hypothetical protein AB7G62_10090 [Magnetospirillum sp.]
MFTSFRLVLVAALALSVSACATRTLSTTDKLTRDVAQPKILLMPADVELSELTAGGLTELNADWTLSGQRNLKAALNEHLAKLNARFSEYQPLAQDDPHYDTFQQLQKLHGVTGINIQNYAFPPAPGLPGKEGKFNWALGPATTMLAESTDSQYALFVWLRDSYTSSGRRALKLAAAILFGVQMEGGKQVGYASLVDLKTGEIVWFNLLARESGDLRDLASARESVDTLLTGLPQ